jgi:ADP-ribosyl-[dinitrogen reductase] hydrolase
MDIAIGDRYRGALLGLAAGDALGTTLEFSRPGGFDPIADMHGGGPFGLAPGQWTDDTSMALCLADSLVNVGGFDLVDQMERYVRWHRDGYMSSTGSCFDIGATVATALRRFEDDGNPLAGSRDPQAGGNGSLMRLAPVPLAWASQPAEAIRLAGVMSATTHAAAEPVDACRYYAGLIVGALQGSTKALLLGPHFAPLDGGWGAGALSPAIARIAAGSFKARQPPEIRGSGYVVHALEAALWAFWHTDSFEAGALAAVNLGEDADTTGAIYGQLAGAWYGVDAIPAHWRDRLARRDLLEELADRLHMLAGEVGAGGDDGWGDG